MRAAIDFWMLIAGVGVFLYGMYMLEEALKHLSGRSFRRWIKNSTGTLLKSVTTGAGTAAIVQSTSAVTLMTLALVGAGVIAMESAIGVIIGSNLGSTITTWLVALVGFKFEIQRIAFPFIGLGGMGLIFFKNSAQYSNIFKLVVGFGLLLLGIDFMKTAAETMTAYWQDWITPDDPLVMFLLVGIVISGITQSGSATLAMTLASVYTGFISFDQAAMVAVGANLGTTVTILIGAMGSEPIKKRVALCHVLFNVASAVLALVLFQPYCYLINEIFGLEQNPELGLAAFHTLFNLAGLLLFIPLIHALTRLVMRIFPDKKEELSVFISQTAPSVTDAAVEATRKELRRLGIHTSVLNMHVLGIDSKPIIHKEADWIPFHETEELYDKIKLLHAEISQYASRILTGDFNIQEAKRLENYMLIARSLLHSAHQSKDIRHYLDSLSIANMEWIDEWVRRSHDHSARMFTNLFELINESIPESDDYTDLIAQLNREDEISLQYITQSISKGTTTQEAISNVLITNRLIHQSQLSIADGLRQVCPSSTNGI